MIIVTNLVLIIMVGLIAYWWANQGMFSALLHLLCVVVAGAIALAFWEPLARLLITGRFFDDYAWGVALLGVFAIALLVLRIAMDKLAPANVQIPNWANLTFGGIIGACSGVLTVGLLIIGLGHIQSSARLAGFRDYGRSARNGEVIPLRGGSLWVPFHTLANEFYGYLSVTSLRTSRPLRHYTPKLDKQASLVRDSSGAGNGKLSLKPDAARVTGLAVQDDGGRQRFFVSMRFDLAAQDFGEQLTLSASQLRLIGQPPSRTAEAPVVHPVAWTQFDGRHRFDDISHYLVSEPGKEGATPVIEFVADASFIPRFIQVRGTRYTLPQMERATAELISGVPQRPSAPIPTGGGSIQSVIRVSNDIRPLFVSLNALPSGMDTGSDDETSRLLTSGEGTFQSGRGVGSQKLRIQGIYEPAGTLLVRVDVSRGGPADIFTMASRVADDARIQLVDASGNAYSPIGYFHTHAGGITIKLDPQNRLPTLDDIPILPTSGDQKMELLFYVTAGARVRGMRFGDTDVGTCDLLVEGRGR